jgi:hypothetical protein
MPDKIECRGRNGWFNYHSNSSWTYTTPDGSKVAYVQLWSRQSGRTSPIMITGPPDKLLALLQDMARKVRKTVDNPKSRMTIVIEDGIFSSVYTDAEMDVDLLVVDNDSHSEDPVLYSRPVIIRSTDTIEKFYAGAGGWEGKGSTSASAIEAPTPLE